jgi:DNA-binding Lrp family transcriptional regulator
MTTDVEGLDDIDRAILRILTQDPRLPYSDIADRLAAEGYEMSSEGIRYRVSKLFETTSVLLLTAPKEHGWEELRLFIAVENEPDAKTDTFEALAEMEFWMTCKLMGTFDIYAIATTPSTQSADRLLERVRGLDHVDRVEHAIEVDRETDVDDYLSL